MNLEEYKNSDSKVSQFLQDIRVDLKVPQKSRLKIFLFRLINEIRQEERERARKIIEGCPANKYCSGPCRGGEAVEKWKLEALKKLNETVL